MHNILQQQPDWRADAGPIAVIGAGGGARAVVYSLAERGAREIRVINRTFARAEALAREFGPPVAAMPWDERHRALDGAAMLVNTTSQGMVGQPPLDLALDALPIAPSCATSSTCRWKRRSSRPRGAAATARSTAWACCCTRRGRRGRRGSASSPKVTPELRALIEATIPKPFAIRDVVIPASSRTQPRNSSDWLRAGCFARMTASVRKTRRSSGRCTGPS